jgi:hypothetical protein
MRKRSWNLSLGLAILCSAAIIGASTADGKGGGGGGGGTHGDENRPAEAQTESPPERDHHHGGRLIRGLAMALSTQVQTDLSQCSTADDPSALDCVADAIQKYGDGLAEAEATLPPRFHGISRSVKSEGVRVRGAVARLPREQASRITHVAKAKVLQISNEILASNSLT